MLLGELETTIPLAAQRLGAGAVLAHVDIGSGNREASLRLGEWLAGELPSLLAPGAIIVGDQPLPNASWTVVDLPHGVRPGRYHMYRT